MLLDGFAAKDETGCERGIWTEHEDVAIDTENWATSKEGSGDGWEPLFLLVLWLRFAGRKVSDVECIPTIEIPFHDLPEKLFYNYPFADEKSLALVRDVNEFREGLDDIPNDHPLWNGRFPKVSIYYPKLANFAEYDVFLCVWRKDSGLITKELYGYQLKEGKEIPGQNAALEELLQ